jgi:hypothetical protein
VPAVVKAAEPAKASKRGRGATLAPDKPVAPPPAAERTSALGPRLHGIAVTGRSLIQQYWSDYDDAALLEIAAETLADLRSGDAKRQHGVWGDSKEAPGEALTTPDADR